MFFFEKKNQKDYVEPGGTQGKAHIVNPHRIIKTVKSFLLLFFKKEVLFSLHLP
jgi:hypothetical protein